MFLHKDSLRRDPKAVPFCDLGAVAELNVYINLESDQFCQKHVVIPDIIEAELVM